MNKIEADFPPEFYSLLMSSDEQAAEVRTARQTQRIDNGIEAQRQVLSIPGKKWGHLYQALREKELLTPKEAGILRIAMQIPAKIPSEKQCAVLIDILEKGRTEGITIE
tara:strand:- start:122 stop:448 length:327 start_codon:yes stop_codon:yes gene_type:complete